MLEWKNSLRRDEPAPPDRPFDFAQGRLRRASLWGGDGARCQAQQELLNFRAAALPAFPPSSSFGLGLWAASLFEVDAIRTATQRLVAEGLRRPDGLLEGATLEYRPCPAPRS